MDCGIESLLLQNLGTILTKEFVLSTDSFTQLKAMNSAFIGITHPLGNFVKMLSNEE
jgi:hypothetical protein